jgi:hypothetical protein
MSLPARPWLIGWGIYLSPLGLPCDTRSTYKATKMGASLKLGSMKPLKPEGLREPCVRRTALSHLFSLLTKPALLPICSELVNGQPIIVERPLCE